MAGWAEDSDTSGLPFQKTTLIIKENTLGGGWKQGIRDDASSFQVPERCGREWQQGWC